MVREDGFPPGSDGKESACSVGHPGSIPESGRSPGEGNGYPLQYSCLENSMDRGAQRSFTLREDEFGISERLSKTRVQFTWNVVEMWAFSLIPQELELLVQRG